MAGRCQHRSEPAVRACLSCIENERRTAFSFPSGTPYVYLFQVTPTLNVGSGGGGLIVDLTRRTGCAYLHTECDHFVRDEPAGQLTASRRGIWQAAEDRRAGGAQRGAGNSTTRLASVENAVIQGRAPVAQMDRVAASEAAGRWFESNRARHFKTRTYRAGPRRRRGSLLPGGRQTGPQCRSIWSRASRAEGAAMRLRATEFRYRVTVFLFGVGLASSRRAPPGVVDVAHVAVVQAGLVGGLLCGVDLVFADGRWLRGPSHTYASGLYRVTVELL